MPDAVPKDWHREDGSVKGLGYLGLLELPEGGVASEFSIADSEKLKDKNGKYLDYPSLVPTLTKDEVQAVLQAAAGKGKLPPAVYKKAEAFALDRQKAGKPLFAEAGEQQALYPELKRAATPEFLGKTSMAEPQTLSDDDLKELAAEAAAGKLDPSLMEKMSPEERSKFQAFGRASIPGKIVEGAIAGGVGLVRGAIEGVPKGVISLAKDVAMGPTEGGRQAVEGTIQLGKDLVSGDPGRMGEAAGSLISPGVYGAGIRGVNSLGHALQESPRAREAFGTVAGTALGVPLMKATGLGAPFIGGMIGRSVMSKFPEIATGTGRALEIMTGGRRGGAVVPEALEGLEQSATYKILASKYGKDTADGWVSTQVKEAANKAAANKASETVAPKSDAVPAPKVDPEFAKGTGVPKDVLEAPAKIDTGLNVKIAPETQAVESSMPSLERTAVERLMRPRKHDISNVPPSKSRRSEMSATEGLTVEDVKALGLNPDLKIKGLTLDASRKLMLERSARSKAYREEAGLDAGAKAAADQDTTDSHGGPDHWNGQKQDMTYAGGDAQFAAKRAKGRAMKEVAAKKKAQKSSEDDED